MNRTKPTALIVDDDHYTIACMKTLMDWGEIGIEPVGFAESGPAALELMREHLPDVLITDITMPVMDGLELAAQAREMREGLYIILLTAYEDFQYVRRGLELGADAYMLKQMDYEKLSAELKQHVVKIIEKRETRRRHIALHQAQELMISELVAAWLNESDPVILEQLMSFESFEPVMKANQLKVVIFDLINSDALANEEVQVLSLEAVGAVIQWLQQYGQGFPVFRIGHSSVGLLCTPELAEIVVKNSFFTDRFPWMGIGFSGIGMPNQAPKLMQEAETDIVLQKMGLRGNEKADGLTEEKKKDIARRIRYASRQFITCLRDGIIPLAVANVSVMTKCAEHAPHILPLVPGYLLRVCLSELSPQNPFTSILMRWCRENMYGKQQVRPEDNVIIQGLHECINQWSAAENNQVVMQQSTLVNKLVAWIDLHMEEELSIRAAADLFLVSPNHLGKLFYRETHEHFSDYVLRVRLERSCDYLENPTLKVYEVAQKLRFRNLSYFHAKFRAHFGCSPGEWRKRK